MVIVRISDFEKMFCVYDGEHNFEIDVEYHEQWSGDNDELKMSKESAKELAYKIAEVCVEHCNLGGIIIEEDN